LVYGDYNAILTQHNTDGNLEWSKKWGGAEDRIGAEGVSVDNQGNILITGWFYETVDFDPGTGYEEHTANGKGDAFLIKMDANGGYLWGQVWGTDNVYHRDIGLNIAIDPNDNPINTGSNGGYSTDHQEGVVRKHKANGTFSWQYTWASQYGIFPDNQAIGIVADIQANIFATGYFCAEWDFDPGPGEDWHDGPNYADHQVILVKLDSNGVFKWARSWGGKYDDEGHGVGIDLNGNAYITGFFMDSTKFDPTGSSDTISAIGGSDIFLTKYLSDGSW
jgi:hypothetical protein